MTQVITLDSSNFDKYALSEGLSIVDFSADWCPPCRIMHPVVAGMAQKFAGQVTFYEVDADEIPEIIMRYNVLSLPTFLFFRDDELVGRLVGARPSGKFEAEISSFVQEAAAPVTSNQVI